MLTVVKFKRPGQQNGVYDAETRWNVNPALALFCFFFSPSRSRFFCMGDSILGMGLDWGMVPSEKIPVVPKLSFKTKLILFGISSMKCTFLYSVCVGGLVGVCVFFFFFIYWNMLIFFKFLGTNFRWGKFWSKNGDKCQWGGGHDQFFAKWGTQARIQYPEGQQKFCSTKLISENEIYSNINNALVSERIF